jgi:hypothetical protein
MAKDILDALENAEREWRETNPEWKRKLRQYNSWMQHSKDRQRQAKKAERQKPDVDKPPPVTDSSWFNSFDPHEPSPQFSFAGGHGSYSKSDMEKDIQGLVYWKSVPKWAIDALRRGIAVHHSGMNKRYRSLVERQVVFPCFEAVILTFR